MKSSKTILAIALIIAGMTCISCGSNTSKKANETQKANVCPICEKSLEGKQIVNATLKDGSTLTMCSSCYTIGRQTGRCL